MILGIDPGLRAPGFAILGELDTLRIARRITIAETLHAIEDPGDRISAVVDVVLGETVRHTRLEEIDVVAFEFPQAYHEFDKVDKNDLFALAGMGMEIHGRVLQARRAVGRGLRLIAPTPNKWAGNLPKSKKKDQAFTSPRGARMKSRLRDGELAAFGPSPTHDAVDAAAIAFFAAGRWAPVRVFHGARP